MSKFVKEQYELAPILNPRNRALAILHEPGVLSWNSLQFGDWITFDTTFVRAYSQELGCYYKANTLPEPQRGIYLGKRVVTNGEYDANEGVYTRRATYTLALVSYSPRNNAVYVPLSRITNDYQE